MKKIKAVAVMGLGALGTLFGNLLLREMPREDLRIIAGEERIRRYQREKVYSNGEVCDFSYVTPETVMPPVDLILIAVKSTQLDQAIQDIRGQVGPDTLILSLLNGITSEEIIAKAYGMDKVVYCVAQGMDAVKEGSRLTYKNMGELCIGPWEAGPIPEKVQRVAEFFQGVGLPHEVVPDMRRRMWGKFMVNVGVNQTLAVLGGTYADIQREGCHRQTMLHAMQEVMALSRQEGVDISEQDLQYWLGILGTLNPLGKPSMRQDVEAGRKTEVELFAGTVLALSKRHAMDAPVNRMLYEGMRKIEASYQI